MIVHCKGTMAYLKLRPPRAMYQYDEHDHQLLEERVQQFRGQVDRYLAGRIPEDEFKALRLRNGLYYQRHAYMLRVAIPYGLLSAPQLRVLARIARDYDRGYGHFTTRQNIQFNWPELHAVPEILDQLRQVEMHAIQTSGNTIRNISSDHLAGVAADELEDPRPYCEILRQWSTLHPEFAWLPRKFKIAVTGSATDRVALKLHDIGLQIIDNAHGERGFRVYVGGGMGRTPIIGKVLREFLPRAELLNYLEAILRIYNLEGRRDNIHKARIKILVRKLGIKEFAQRVEREWQAIRDPGLQLADEEIEAMSAHFQAPEYAARDESRAVLRQIPARARDAAFETWLQHNTFKHKQSGFRIVFVSLKAPGRPPGDVTATQLEVLADLAEDYSFGTLRSSHDQNLVLADVHESDLHTLWRRLNEQHLASPNIGTLNDMICCPGLEFCSLANADTLPVAQQINERFADYERLYDIGHVQLKMSGCMNACAHHHVGHIGILGVDKHGEQWYQFTLGGSADERTRLGNRLGAAVEKHRVADVIADLLDVYLEHRHAAEAFIDTYLRIGIQPFREQVYADHPQPENSRGSLAA